MFIDKAIIKEHEILNDQVWVPNEGLNIITSKNGGGKTLFANKVKKSFKKAIFLNQQFIDNFFTSRYLNEYVKNFKKNTYETIIYKYISEFYSRLNSGENFTEEFNQFSQELHISIGIDKEAINAGIIRFINNLGNKIDFNNISNSEKTAFVLWLATKCETDILILDNIDAVFYDSNVFYTLLYKLSDTKQIISTSNRKVEILQECQFVIEDGKIEKYV